MEKNWENFLCMFAIEYVSLFYVVKCVIDFCVYLHFFSRLFFITVLLALGTCGITCWTTLKSILKQ